MKAFVFLCLHIMVLCVTRAQQPTAVCTPGVCGCCLIEKQLERTEAFFYKMHEQISEDLNDTKQALTNIKAPRSVFSAILTTDEYCNAPAAPREPVVYDSVQVDLGGNYNQGVFTAPLTGIYIFALTLYNNSPEKQQSCAALMVKGKQQHKLIEEANADMKDSASVAIIVALEAEDVVMVRQPADCYICGKNNRFNTFTGYLLYSTAI